MKVIKKDKDVIAKEEERKEADKLNEEFYNTGIPEEMTDDVSDESEWELSPVEDMSIQIAGYLSDLTSKRFAEMVDGMEVDTIKQIVGRLNGAGHEEAVRMMQAMFLISGDFMLYRRSLERLHLSERTAGSDFKTTFCDENGNTVTLEHKSSSGGEGTIYTTDLEGKVAKLFNQQAAKKKEKKLKTGSLIDLCILTYNGNGVQEYGKPGFTPISDVEERFVFTPFGSSPLFTAANTALNLLLRQIELYRENQVVSDKGWLIIFSDGQADDGIGGEISFEGLRSRFSNSEIKKRINVLCGCFGYQYDNLEAVTARSAIKNMLEENNFVGYIQSLSHSIQVQSRPVEDGYN